MNPIPPQPAKGAWHSQSAEEVLAQLGSAATGLSATEAARRLAADGPNERKEGKRISPWQIFLGQFKSLIIWILIAAGVISVVLGEVVDAIAILAIVVLNAVIGFYQEFKAEKSIAALKKMTAPQAKVRRDGQVTSIPAAGIVVGDILALEAGDLWATGRGSDIIQPMAIPSVGGMVVSVLVTIYIAPCLFCAVEEWKWKWAQRLAPKGAAA